MGKLFSKDFGREIKFSSNKSGEISGWWKKGVWDDDCKPFHKCVIVSGQVNIFWEISIWETLQSNKEQ